MGWETSNRKQRLPKNWASIRQQVMRRDGHRCVAVLADGSRCEKPGADVDHIVPMSDDHRLEALQLLCSWHHAQKTGREASAVAHAMPPKRRPAEPHPGLIDPP